MVSTQSAPEPLSCELCGGVLEPSQPGAVLHLLLRLVTDPNPHIGWWRNHPEGARFLCDACYAENVHPLLAAETEEPYLGRYQAAARSQQASDDVAATEEGPGG